VNAKLTLFVVVSVGVAVLIALVASALGVRDDESQVLRVVRSFDAKVLPVVALISLVVVTIVGHAVARLARSDGLKGTVQDSINAAFGFSAFFIPLATLLIAVAVALGSGAFTAVAGIALAVVVVWYLPAALAATHPGTSRGQAFMAFGTAVVFTSLIASGIAALSGG
jgi:hypothetical protein